MLVVKKGTSDYQEINTAQLKEMLCRFTGIDYDKYKKDSFTFKLKGKRDMMQKKVVFPRRKVLLNTISRTEQGESVIYAFCNNIKLTNKGGYTSQELSPRYPKELVMEKESAIVPKSQLDLLVYMVMYPECQQSPYNKGVYGYQLHNPAEKAKADINTAKEKSKTEYYILHEASMERLTAFLQSEGYSRVELMNEDEVRSKVLHIAQVNIPLFNTKINSSDINVKSDAQMFADAKVCVVRTVNNAKEWRVGLGEEKGDPICSIPAGQDEIKALADFFKKTPVNYDYIKNLYIRTSGITGKIEQKAASKSESFVETEENTTTQSENTQQITEQKTITPSTANGIADKVEALVENGLIRFDGMRKVVGLYNKDTNKKIPKDEGGDLLANTTKDTWYKDLIAHLGTEEGKASWDVVNSTPL